MATRCRAQMILLRAQGMDAIQIVKVTFTSPGRVRDVIHAFNTDGFDSLTSEILTFSWSLPYMPGLMPAPVHPLTAIPPIRAIAEPVWKWHRAWSPSHAEWKSHPTGLHCQN